ncbi:MAG: M20/M25/M40 family metallo-hydrolase [Candidatus Binataceae bacterium]|nr:M20/M25/M40 family metallo-hydrolase [Candidatus Binataceae bacterium]
MRWAISLPVAIVMLMALMLPGAVTPPALARPIRRHTLKPTPPKVPIDWDKLTQEASGLLANYIRINTTDPPGNELPAAKMLREKFLAEGIPATIWESSPGRAILAARLHGIGHHTKSIILLSHMDVVPANPREWQVPPFSGTLKNGEIWGRGALDDKGPAVVELMAMLAIKRMGVLLNRDVLFLATAGEEVGGAAGAGWVIDHKPELYSDAGYLLNEGGGIQIEKGRKLYTVSVTEKTPLWIRLTASGAPGHAAVPPARTSVTRLIAALDRLDTYRTQIRVINPVRDYFHELATLGDAPAQFNDLAKALRDDPAFARNFVESPSQNAQVRDTITPTVLGASDKTNTIPATAYAEVDCRLLPGSDSKEFLASIRKVINDKSIKSDVLLNFPPVSSPQKSLLMNAIRMVGHRFDQAPAVPRLLDGFTDSHYFRQKGIVAYGFIPLEIAPAEMHEVHGVNERIAVKNLQGGIERMVDLLEILGGREGS